MASNKLFFGDNLGEMREHIRDESIDLVYLDPPFNSKRNYNLIFRTPKGHQSDAQFTAFEDSWQWGAQAEREFKEVRSQANTDASEVLQSLRRFLGDNDMLAYLTMMTNRLLELHRVLKPTGSLYLHCDPTASHYLKIVLDAIFGPTNYRNEISWERSHTRSSITKVYRRAHDVLLFYTKSDTYTFNMQYRRLSQTSEDLYSASDEKGRYQAVPLLVSGKRNGETGKPWHGIDPNSRGKEGMHWVTTPDKLDEYERQGLILWPKKEGGVPRLKYYLEDSPGVPMNDFWDDVPFIASSSQESLGYPTQKPLALLERIISTSSNPGDIVLDPFCGCGSSIHAAQRLGRRWIGIDITHLAISLIEKRLRDAFPGISFETAGTPRDIDGARDLAARDKYQFEWWACSLVNAQPYKGKKKGADGGIDGIIYFTDATKGPDKKIIVSVKGGDHVTRTMIADLKNTVDREGAQIGLFVTLTPPTKPMVVEAAAAGFYSSPHHGDFPKIQILTIEGLLAGRERASYPDMARGAQMFKRAKTERPGVDQQTLDLE